MPTPLPTTITAIYSTRRGIALVQKALRKMVVAPNNGLLRRSSRWSSMNLLEPSPETSDRSCWPPPGGPLRRWMRRRGAERRHPQFGC